MRCFASSCVLVVACFRAASAIALPRDEKSRPTVHHRHTRFDAGLSVSPGGAIDIDHSDSQHSNKAAEQRHGHLTYNSTSHVAPIANISEQKLVNRSLSELPTRMQHLSRLQSLQRALTYGFSICLGCAVWLASQSLALGKHKPYILSLYDAGLICSYIFLSAGSTLALRQTRGSEVLSTLEGAFLLYILKACVSLGLLVFKQSMPFKEILSGLQSQTATFHGKQVPVWCCLALNGVLFAGYDVLSLGVSQHLPPLSFQLLLYSRTLILVPLQYCLLGKPVCKFQFCALCIICVAACAIGVGDVSGFSLKGDVLSRDDYFFGIALMMGKIVVSAVVLVANEKLLKELPFTVDAQNLLTYSSGMMFLGVGVTSWAYLSSKASSMESEMGFVLTRIFRELWMLCAVVLMTGLGVICAYLLKRYSALEKEVMASCVVAVLAIGQALTPSEHGFTILTAECGASIVASSITFCCLNSPPPATKDAKDIKEEDLNQ